MMPGRLRVLIVDDHPGIVKALSRLLLAADYDVVGSVSDSATLLDAARHHKPDVIVLDVNLPNADGLKACRQITQASPEVKVIVFTASEDRDLRQRALAAGAADYVDKRGFDGELLAALERLDAGRN